jgi:ligand-binding sensor domain-containing protein
MKTGWVRQIILEHDSLAWVGTYGEGLFRVIGGEWGRVRGAFKGDYVLCLKQENNALWIGTARNGAYCFSRGNFAQWDTTNGLCDNNVWDIGPGPEGEALFGSRYHGITRMKAGRFSCIARDSGLPDNGVTVISRDSRNRWWIGTALGGLCGIGEGDTVRLNRASGLSGNYIRAFLCDSGVRCVGSWDGGLDTLSGKGWEHVAAVAKPVAALARDGGGRLWAGTWGSGIFVRTAGGWKNLTSGNSGLPDDHVIDIKFDSRGNAWLATNKGLARYGVQRDFTSSR